jgi:hypothetical protein
MLLLTLRTVIHRQTGPSLLVLLSPVALCRAHLTSTTELGSRHWENEVVLVHAHSFWSQSRSTTTGWTIRNEFWVSHQNKIWIIGSVLVQFLCELDKFCDLSEFNEAEVSFYHLSKHWNTSKTKKSKCKQSTRNSGRIAKLMGLFWYLIHGVPVSLLAAKDVKLFWAGW